MSTAETPSERRPSKILPESQRSGALYKITEDDDNTTKSEIPHTPPRKFKITKLTELKKKPVQLFLQEFRIAKRLIPQFQIDEVIFGDALERMMFAEVNIDEELEVIKYLKDFVKEQQEYEINKPYQVVKDKLKWPKDEDLSLEEQLSRFFEKLVELTKESQKAGTLNKKIKKHIIFNLLEVIPKEFEVDKEDFLQNSDLYEFDSFKELLKSRVNMARKAINRGRKSKHKVRTCEIDESLSVNRVDPRNAQPSNQRGNPQNWRYNNQPIDKNNIRNTQAEVGIVGACWNCGRTGHEARQCQLPKTNRFYENLRKFREARDQRLQGVGNQQLPNQRVLYNNRNINPNKPRVFRVKTSNAITTQIMLKTDKGWVNTPGCLDSGARVNVAPVSLLKYATDQQDIRKPTYFKLPDGTHAQPIKTGKIELQVKLNDDIVFPMGEVQCYLMDGKGKGWNEILIGELTLKYFNLMPEQAMMKEVTTSE